LGVDQDGVDSGGGGSGFEDEFFEELVVFGVGGGGEEFGGFGSLGCGAFGEEDGGELAPGFFFVGVVEVDGEVPEGFGVDGGEVIVRVREGGEEDEARDVSAGGGA